MSDENEQETEERSQDQDALGIRLRAADPQYITHQENYDTEDVVMSVKNARDVMRLKIKRMFDNQPVNEGREVQRPVG